VEKEFFVELIGELHRVEFCRQQHLELIEACVLLGFSQFAVAFLVFSFVSYLGISSIPAIAVARYGVFE
jgi:hypothetical protein